MSRKLSILVVFMVLVITTLACGGSNTGEKVGESQSATSAPVKVETYKAGDIIKVEDYTITLNSANISGSKLVANFTIDNSSGAKEQAVSSVISFEAKADDGTKLDYSLCDGSQLDGSILSGDKLKGNVCWDGAKSGGKYKIYYNANLFASGSIVWEVQ